MGLTGRKEGSRERGRCYIYCPYIGDGAEFQVGRLRDDMHRGSKAAPPTEIPGEGAGPDFPEKAGGFSGEFIREA